MPDKKFDLGDYVEVKDRIALFYDLFGQGRLVTDTVEILTSPEGKQRVMVKALAYRTPDDPHPAAGHSWMELPGTTSYTKGSELENTETSAWGRAIAALGILIDRSIASAQEVGNKNGTLAHNQPVEDNGIGGLVGTIEKGKPPVDMEIRFTKDEGAAWGFALRDGRTKFQVMAHGRLAEDLADLQVKEGERVTVWGPIEPIPWNKKQPDGTIKVLHYNRITLERIAGASFDLRAGDYEAPANRLTDEEKAAIAGDLPLEAESVPLFSDAAEVTA